jgi:Tol biopolymer transport system component
VTTAQRRCTVVGKRTSGRSRATWLGRPIPRRRLLAGLALVLALVAVSGCGSDEQGNGISIKGSIVFASPHGNAAWIYVLGSGGTRLIAKDGSVAAAQPAWSPDGKLVAYVNRRGQIVVVKRDGSDPTAVTPSVDPDDPAAALVWNLAWLPDGRISFAVTQQTPNALGLGVVNVDGSNRRLLSNQHTDSAAFSGVYAWAPDGMRAVFVCSFGDLTRPRMCLFDTVGGGVRALAQPPVHISHLDWSASNNEILAGEASDAGGQGAQRLRSVYVLNARGRILRTIRQPRSISDATWSPDGTMIAYSSQRSSTGSFGLWLARADGSQAKRLTTLPGLEPDWSKH